MLSARKTATMRAEWYAANTNAVLVHTSTHVPVTALDVLVDQLVAEFDANDRKVGCNMCRTRRHPANMYVMPGSVDGDSREYLCGECRWGL